MISENKLQRKDYHVALRVVTTSGWHMVCVSGESDMLYNGS